MARFLDPPLVSLDAFGAGSAFFGAAFATVALVALTGVAAFLAGAFTVALVATVFFAGAAAFFAGVFAVAAFLVVAGVGFA